MSSKNNPIPIHQCGRHKGKLIQTELQIEGMFCAGDPHPEFKGVVFAYLKNGKQRWSTTSDLTRRKESIRKASSRCYYSKVPDELLTPYGQVRREMKRDGIERMPRDEFKGKIDLVKVNRGLPLEPEPVQNQQYEPINTNSTEFLMQQAEKANQHNEFIKARQAAFKKAEADLAEEIGSDNFWDLNKAGLRDRMKAAEEAFLQSVMYG